jgi:phosphatidylserine decarboxylase
MWNLKTTLEQYRQARSIHGGLTRLLLAGLAVRLARLRIPSKRLRLRLYRTIYGKKYTALDETELEQPLWAYPSFNALFTRGVRPELRPIPNAAGQFLCPCDGRVQDIGLIRQGKILTVKGVEYTLSSLLAAPEKGTGLLNSKSPVPFSGDVGRFDGGPFAILFLSPTDCHRIFSPQHGEITDVVHVPGYRLLVHPPYQKKEFPVFALNERVILRLKTPLGEAVLVLVAGWGVGNITLTRDAAFRPRPRRLSRKTYHPPLPVRAGEWIATFELGSTAILLSEPLPSAAPRVARDEKVRYGQPLFSLT